MINFDRYGAVEINNDEKITSFKEKNFYQSGLINGGIYLLNKNRFLENNFPQKFSFEQHYLEKYYTSKDFYGCKQEGYFIDIGVPADFEKAQNDLRKPDFDLKKINKDWTIFIDRDGVINNELPGTYVLNWKQFVFSEGVLEAFKILNEKFDSILVVSNQRGVGKGLMSLDDLHSIHNEMQKEVAAAHGRIDKIYCCTEIDGKCFDRKPNPGMAIQALKDFPQIDLNKSIMIGNKPGDMRFGCSAGMHTVFLTTTNPAQAFPHPEIDLQYSSLLQLAEAL
jgi:D-glycero-alpha-D-manno-heptose 1-phosphate guanylyltransferase